MKTMLWITLAAAWMAASGCGKQTGTKATGDESPAFMFWCHRPEIVSADFHIPDMDTAPAATYLQNRMQTIPGFAGSECDLRNRKMTIRYQSSTVRKMNFEEAIALSGFAVNNRPANPNAPRPEGVK